MPYTLYSPHNPREHDSLQWMSRNFVSEVQSIQNRNILRAFALLNSDAPMKIIEAGCGLGGWVQYFQEQGHDVVGIEYVDEVINRAKKVNPYIPIQKGDVTTLQFPDNFFDVYVSLGVIEHFEEGPSKALREAYRVLRPNGIAFIATPLLTPLRRLIAHPLRDLYFIINEFRGKEKYFWEYRYTEHELENHIKSINFQIVDKYIDDYSDDKQDRHIGLWADFFFLRSRCGIWKLNNVGRTLLKLMRATLSPWSYCSGIMFHAQAIKNP